MSKLAWFLFGVLAICTAIVLGGGVFLMGAHGFSAREQPGALERWTARRARSMATPTGAKEQTNPSVDSPEVLADARAHWADHCATCHANNGNGETEIGKHMYPPAPDMREADTQDLSDGELFYIIQNGIRLTGMPAWGSGSAHDTKDSWKLVRFIRHLPKLTAEEEAEMKEMNPKSPDELKEEQEEQEFLNGDQSHEHTQHEHHHFQVALLAIMSLALLPTIATAHGGEEHVTGTVSKISATSVTVKTTDGKSTTIGFDAKTTYARGKESIQKTDIKVGDKIVIHAEEVNEKLVAHTVEIGAPTAAKQATKQ